MTSRVLVCAIAAVTTLIALFFIIDRGFSADLSPREQSQVILAEDGSVLRAFPDSKGVWRYPISGSEVSPNYLEALIGYEDRFFYSHPGVNPLSLIRALWQWLSNGKVISGGSTLTMQVARLRYPAKRTVTNKLIEIFRGLQLELHYSKKQILEYYLNHAPFGGTREGVQAAAFHYFGYSAHYLTDAQAALLAVLPQAPSHLRPDRFPERAREARDKLLNRLQENKLWDIERVQQAKIEPVEITDPPSVMNAPLLSRRLHNHSQSARVQTYINPVWQQQISELLQQYVGKIADRTSAAALIVETQSGKVKAYIGSADFSDTSRFSHVDMIQAHRSPGSTLKPFIYGLAIDQGLIHSGSLLMDIPSQFGDYRPENFTQGYAGPVTTTTALQQSLNIPAVQVLNALGPKHFYLALKRIGSHPKLPKESYPSLAIALGGLGIRMENLVELYTALGAGGKIHHLQLSQEDTARSSAFLSEGAAWIIQRILSQGLNRGYAIKTGTSHHSQDNWAIASSHDYTVGIWVGRPDGGALQQHYGRETAVPLLQNILQLLPSPTPMSPPNAVKAKQICWPDGDQAGGQCQFRHDAYILDDTYPRLLASSNMINATSARYTARPKETTDATCGDVSVTSATYSAQNWPVALLPWLEKRSYGVQAGKMCTPLQKQHRAPQAQLILKGIDPDLLAIAKSSSQSVNLALRILGGRPPYHWIVNDEVKTTTSARLTLAITKATDYDITVVSHDGLYLTRKFQVKE